MPRVCPKYRASAALALALLAPCLAGVGEPSRTVVGTVADFHGKFGLVVRDERGQLTDVTLRRGTIINPRGLRLARGMQVTVQGEAAEGTFAASAIDAPYEYRSGPNRGGRLGDRGPWDGSPGYWPPGDQRTDPSPPAPRDPEPREPPAPRTPQ